jgi:type III pantothenate kinase
MKVVATGGLGRVLVDDIPEIDVYNPALTLEGLRILYEKNRKVKPTESDYEDNAN